MGDKYNIHNTQAGAIGKNASAINTTFNNNESKELEAELVRLLSHLSKVKTNSEQEKEIESVKEAIVAAKDHKPGKVREILKGVGKWVLEIAKEIGAGLVTKLISNT